ncbi:MAG: deoxyribonuclease HsdR, partial [Proteiniphilum sp.]
MNTKNGKNVLAIVLVAILSSVVTLLGYNMISGKKGGATAGTSSSSSAKEIGMLADSFGQDRNMVLTSLTTPDGYPDFTEAATRSVDGVVHVKAKTISQQQ